MYLSFTTIRIDTNHAGIYPVILLWYHVSEFLHPVIVLPPAKTICSQASLVQLESDLG